MDIFSNILLQVILVSYPLLFYLYYSSYVKENKDILIDLVLLFSIYLFSIYSSIINVNNYIIINIPIIIAYALNKKRGVILLSILTIVFYYKVLNYNFIYVFIEYLVYFLIYIIYKKYKLKTHYYLLTFISIKFIIYLPMINDIYLYIFECIVFYAITIFCYILIELSNNITDYKEKVKELEKEKQIREMIFKITHEIKNPIAVSKGYLDMINLDNKSKTKKYIDNIKNEIDKTLVLLQDFLSLRKIQITKDIIDINILLEENLELLKSYTKNNNTLLKYELLDDDIYVNGDYNRLGQVITNVVKNSVEAIRNKKGIINIYNRIDETNVYIYFKDNGEGISEEDLLKLKSESYTTKINGNGIGILLCNEIMIGHDGELIYESKIGEGTTTIMKLPLHKFS